MNAHRIRISKHAWERYCQRVEPIGRARLYVVVKEDLAGGYYAERGYLLAAGIWWRATVADAGIQLHTCYGESHLDMPAAIRWSRRHNDRIVLP